MTFVPQVYDKCTDRMSTFGVVLAVWAVRQTGFPIAFGNRSDTYNRTHPDPPGEGTPVTPGGAQTADKALAAI